METRVLPFTGEAIAEAARLILAGRAGRGADRDGLRPRRRRHQRRPRSRRSTPPRADRRFNPLIVHVADLAAAEAIGPVRRRKRARWPRQHWPGPLTLVVPLQSERAASPRIVTAGLADHRASGFPRIPRCRRCSRAVDRPARRPLGQCQRPDQPDPRRACAGEPRRPDPADRRRRPNRSAASNRPSSPRPAAPLRLLRPRPDRGRRSAGNHGGAIESPGQLASHYAPVQAASARTRSRRATTNF